MPVRHLQDLIWKLLFKGYLSLNSTCSQGKSVQVHNLVATPQITFTRTVFHKSDFPFSSPIEITFWYPMWKHCNVHLHRLSQVSMGQEGEKQTRKPGEMPFYLTFIVQKSNTTSPDTVFNSQPVLTTMCNVGKLYATQNLYSSRARHTA